MSSGNIAESLPCPEARNWNVKEWDAYYRQRQKPYSPQRKLAALPRPVPIAIETLEAPTVPQPEPKSEESYSSPSRRIYSAPIGPSLPAGDDLEFAEPQRRVWTIDDLRPDQVDAEDLIPWGLIVAWVCSKHQLTLLELFSSRRTVRLTEPRFELSGLAKRHTLLSLPDIGRRMGGRDHTTVLHAIRKFEGWVAEGRMIPWQAERMGER